MKPMKLIRINLFFLLLAGLTGCMSLIPMMAPTVDAEKNISEEFPYPSKFVDVLDSRMHYVKVGEGAPLLTPPLVEQLKSDLPRMETQSIGPGLHFIQETQPTAIGKSVDKWVSELPPWKGEL